MTKVITRGVPLVLILAIAVWAFISIPKPELQPVQVPFSSSIDTVESFTGSFTLNSTNYEWGEKGSNFTFAEGWNPAHDEISLDMAEGEVHMVLLNHQTDDGKCAVSGSLRLGKTTVNSQQDPEGPCTWRNMKSVMDDLLQQMRDANPQLLEKYNKFLDVIIKIINLYLG